MASPSLSAAYSPARSEASRLDRDRRERDHDSAGGHARERDDDGHRSHRSRGDDDRRDDRSSSRRHRDDDRHHRSSRDSRDHRDDYSSSRRDRDRDRDDRSRRDRDRDHRDREPRDLIDRIEPTAPASPARSSHRSQREASHSSVAMYGDDIPPPPPASDERKRRRDSYGSGGRGGYDDRRQGGGGRDRSPAPRRQRRSPSYSPARNRSPELTEEERETRSVFVSSLSSRIGDRELHIFFDRSAGPVRDARVIVDRVSKRSKGVGYVEFRERASVDKALALTGTKVLGVPIIVGFTEAEKNRQASVTPSSLRSQAGLYIGSLSFDLSAADLRAVFSPFGPIESVDLHTDPLTGKSKGFGFVQFKSAQNAVTALEKMDGFNLAGREIKVSMAVDRAPPPGKESALDEAPGAALNNISRIELMQKLARTKEVEIPTGPIFRPNIPSQTSRNVLLKNAFDPAEETEADWDKELGEDVREEAGKKYGKVDECWVLKESAGEIYLRFTDIETAQKAVEGFNGRWFGGRQIQAGHVADAVFWAHRP